MQMMGAYVRVLEASSPDEAKSKQTASKQGPGDIYRMKYIQGEWGR
jgi:hypothetical protein